MTSAQPRAAEIPESSDVRLELRYGIRRSNPHQNEWHAGDIGAGFAYGLVSIAVLSAAFPIIIDLWTLLSTLVSSGVEGYSIAFLGLFSAYLPVTLLYGLFTGAIVLFCYGVPVAALLATMLRTVSQEWAHLAVFALAGALGGIFGVSVLLMGTLAMHGWWLPLGIIGALTAVSARYFAKRRAIKRWDAQLQHPVGEHFSS